MGRVTPRTQAPEDRGSVGPPVALTADAWYTLYYITGPGRQALSARRRRVWSEPFVRHGWTRSRILALLDRRGRWTRDLERKGRTPSVREQVAQLVHWSSVPIDGSEMVERLDQALLRTEVRAAPGALGAIRALDRAGVPLGVVSNVMNESGTVARSLLERLGLLRHFRVVVLSCEHPWSKPSPEPFRLACRFLAVPTGAAVHIGDLGYDIEGARAAGMSAWWYVGLRRYNRYLSGQVVEGTVTPAQTVRSWSAVPSRFD